MLISDRFERRVVWLGGSGHMSMGVGFAIGISTKQAATALPCVADKSMASGSSHGAHADLNLSSLLLGQSGRKRIDAGAGELGIGWEGWKGRLMSTIHWVRAPGIPELGWDDRASGAWFPRPDKDVGNWAAELG